MSIYEKTQAYIQMYDKPFILSCEEPVGRWYGYTACVGDGSGGLIESQIEISVQGVLGSGIYWDIQSFRAKYEVSLVGAGELNVVAFSSERLHGAESWSTTWYYRGIYQRVPDTDIPHIVPVGYNPFKLKASAGYGVYSGITAYGAHNAVGQTLLITAGGYLYDMMGKSYPFKK